MDYKPTLSKMVANLQVRDLDPFQRVLVDLLDAYLADVGRVNALPETVADGVAGAVVTRYTAEIMPTPAVMAEDDTRSSVMQHVYSTVKGWVEEWLTQNPT